MKPSFSISRHHTQGFQMNRLAERLPARSAPSTRWPSRQKRASRCHFWKRGRSAWKPHITCQGCLSTSAFIAIMSCLGRKPWSEWRLRRGSTEPSSTAGLLATVTRSRQSPDHLRPLTVGSYLEEAEIDLRRLAVLQRSGSVVHLIRSH